MSIKAILFFPIMTLICLFYSDSSAQSSNFKAGFVAGLNFAELEGNGITDYFGPNAGLIGTVRLARHSQLGMEILFSQNGEYILPDFYPDLKYGRVRLNHVEVPIHFDWLIGVFERDKYYDLNLNIGLAYTRLLSYNIENTDKENVNDQIVYGSKEAFLLQAGTTYNFTKNWGLNFKASLPIRIEGLNWTIAARIIYMINN